MNLEESDEARTPSSAGFMQSIDRLTDLLVDLSGSDLRSGGQQHGSVVGAGASSGPDAYSDTHSYRTWLDQREELGLDGIPDDIPSRTVRVLVDATDADPLRLRRCLDSLASQSLRPSSVVVVGHGHTVDVSEIARVADWVAIVNGSDVLDKNALAHVAIAADDLPGAQVIYTDEDHIDDDGGRSRPLFKTDWSPDLFDSCQYLGHFVLIRPSLLELTGEPDVTRTYDLLLRVTEVATEVVHIPRVLCHRGGPELGWYAVDELEEEKGLEALERALERRGEPGRIELGPLPGTFYVRRTVAGSPLVSIVIPFRDQAPMLRTCVDSLVVDPGHERFEMILVDNDSIEPETQALLDRLESRPGHRIIDSPGDFNWSAINNAAAAACDGDALLFLNNDIEARKAGWLGALVEQAFRTKVGAVGARLLYPDGAVQHVGTVPGLGVIAAHVMPGLAGDAPGYLGFAKLVRNVSAVTGACMMCRHDVFDQAGGFDEDLHVAFNDVDFCMRLTHMGYRIVFTPLAELIHHESVSRGFTGFYRDYTLYIKRWQESLKAGDPFFSPNLSRLNSTRVVVRPAEEDEEWEANLSALMS